MKNEKQLKKVDKINETLNNNIIACQNNFVVGLLVGVGVVLLYNKVKEALEEDLIL